MRPFLPALLLLILLSSFASDNPLYPTDYFTTPVGHAINLAGNFGEMRPDHFHAGLDIKSKDGVVGEPVFAAADGYIGRIKISPNGYGKVLYVVHPNGYTTVYAHLLEFNSEIQNFCKKIQYKNKAFDLDIALNADQFPVKKGVQIARLGNSGSSQGPHLHFEIRDTKTEKIINPLLFGMPVADNIPPKIFDLKLYVLNDKLESVKEQIFSLAPAKKADLNQNDTLIIDGWRAAFSIKTYDQTDNNSNLSGVYQIEEWSDEELIYKSTMETFAFDDARYCNAHMDYAEHALHQSYYTRCFVLPGNPLNFYQRNDKNGVITLHQNKPTKIRILARDYFGNATEFSIFARRADSVSTPPARHFNYVLPYDQPNAIKTDDLKLYFPKGCFYENVYLDYVLAKEQSYGVYSPVHHIHNHTIPLHTFADIAIKPVNFPADKKEKAFIAYCSSSGTIYSCGGSWENEMLKAKINLFGDYCIMIDETPPTIKPILFHPNMKKDKKIQFVIRDNYSTKSKVPEFTWTASVDGEWILMDYDSKYDLLTYTFDEHVGAGKHTLKVEATDSRGNTASWEKEFVR